MSSLLSRQLEVHRATNPLPPPADAKKARPSILFKDKANTLDAKQILDIGRNGLQRLSAVDANFKKYQSSLFSTALGSDSRSERQLLPRTEREQVDIQCKDLLIELSSHLHTDAGKQVLEFLIQRYFVHIYNADALFCAVLPLHETELFTNVASLPSLAISGTKWAFLSKIKLDSRGLTRQYLVQVATKDVALFDEVCRASCVHSPRFFAAFALECFERLSQSSSTTAQLESTVSVVTRSALEALKVDNFNNVVAACAVIGTMARLTFLAVEACEAFLIVLSKRLDTLGKKPFEMSDEGRNNVARCLVQLYEWQARSGSPYDGKGVSLFKEDERWRKFERYIFKNMTSIVDAEGGRASKLLDDVSARYVSEVNVEGLKLIKDLLSWTGEAYTERSVRVLRTAFHAFLKVEDDADAESLREFTLNVSSEQPGAFEAVYSSFDKEKREIVVSRCFPDGNTPLAIRLVPFENDLNLPLAVRDGRITVRLNAFRHLMANPAKITDVLFEDQHTGSDSLALLLMRNYVAEEATTKESREEFKLLIQLFQKVMTTLSTAIMDAFHPIARQALMKSKTNRDVAVLLIRALRGHAFPVGQTAINGKTKGKKTSSSNPVIVDNEDNVLLLAKVGLDQDFDEEVRVEARKAVEGSWLADLGMGEESAKSVAMRLKQEPLEEIEHRMVKLADILPETTRAILDELISFKVHAKEMSECLLTLIEKEKLPGTAIPKVVAQSLLSKHKLEDIAQRLLTVPVASWPHALPILAEVIAISPDAEANDFLYGACKVSLASVTSPSSEAENEARIVVRALRLLRAHLVAHGVPGGQSGKKSSDKVVAWLPLLGALRHPLYKQVRVEALNVLALIPGKLSEVMLTRRTELERDATALDRAVARDDEVRTLLAKQALAACDRKDFAACRAIVECLNDSALASSVLLKLFDLTREVVEHAKEIESLVEIALEHVDVEEVVGKPKKKTAAELVELCKKGVELFPQPTLSWMSRNYSSIPPSPELFDALLTVAQADQNDAQVDDVERSGFLLCRIAFPESLVLSRLKESRGGDHSKTQVAAPMSARKRRTASIDSNNPVVGSSITTLDVPAIRRLSVLVDIAAAHPPRSLALIQELLSLLKISRVTQAGLLEQSIMSALERNAETVASADVAFKETFCDQMIEEANQATSLTARYAAIRAFCKSRPSFDAYAKGFTMITDVRALQDLAEALTSPSPNPASSVTVPSGAKLIGMFCESIHRLQPPNRLQLLRSLAARCDVPAELVARWIRLSGSDADCSAIASQFKSSVQTDLLIRLINSNHVDNASVGFVNKHLASQAFLLALVERDDSDISQFIELFEGLLRRILECEEQNENGAEDTATTIRLLESALDNLSVLLNVPVFIPVVAEILQNTDTKVRLLALRVLKTKVDEEYADWKKEEARYVVEFAETLLSWIAEGDLKHTTILAINALASVLSHTHKEVFAKGLPVLANVLSDQVKGDDVVPTQSAASLCIGTIVKNIGTLALSHLSTIVPKLIDCAIGRIGGDKEILRQAATTSLKDLVESKVPLGAQLGEIVQKVALQSETDVELLECVGQNVEIRLGFPLCLQAFRSEVSFERSTALFDLFVTRATPSDAVVHFAELKELASECLRRAHSVDSFDPQGIVKIGLLLSEKRLKDLMEMLVAFVEETQEVDDQNGEAEEFKPHAAVDALLETIRALTEKCGNLFLPILPFEFVMNNLVAIVKGAKSVASAGESSSSDADDKKSKKKSGAKRQKLVAGFIGSNVQSSLETALRCINEILGHSISTSFIDSDKFEQLVPPLVMSLQVAPVEFTSQFVEPTFASLAHCVLTSSQANAMLQTLHHAITKLLRSDSSQVRQAALSCVKTLFTRVGNDYLVLMPDTLPYLAELLEDKDENVRILAQKVALVLRDLSGEDISEFLK